jgi:hypothetical protein
MASIYAPISVIGRRSVARRTISALWREFDRKVAHAIRTIAEAKGVTVAQIAIAECFLGDDFRILVGACRPDMLAESLGTLTKNAPSLSGLAMAHNLLR